MKIIDLLFKLKKDGVLKTIENINSTEELVSEIISLKNAQLADTKIAHTKLVSFKKKLEDTIQKERLEQQTNEDLSLIDLKNNNKKKAFKLLKSALEHEKTAIHLTGKLQKITQNITDIEFDIDTMNGELTELYEAQDYVLNHNKQDILEDAENKDNSLLEKYKSSFVSLSARKIDAILHAEEVAFEKEHYSIKDKLNYDDIEVQLESIKAKIKP